MGAPPGPASGFFAAYEALRHQDCEAALAQVDQPVARHERLPQILELLTEATSLVALATAFLHYVG